MFGKSMGIAALFVASLAGTACTNRSGLNFSGGSGGAGAGANGGQAGGADSGVASGGTVGMGGAVGAGRTVGTGGAIGSGGAVGSGGVSIGGAVGSGGAVALGGTLGFGGAGVGGTNGTGGGAGGSSPCHVLPCPLCPPGEHAIPQPNPNDPCGCAICVPDSDAGLAKDANATDSGPSCLPTACPMLACVNGILPSPDPCGCPTCAPNLDAGTAKDSGNQDGRISQRDVASLVDSRTRTPLQHRAVATTCPTGRAPGLSYTNPAIGECAKDSTCLAGINGRCLIGGPLPVSACSYDDCFSDADCPANTPCDCRSSAASQFPNSCLTGSDCRVDSDCGPGNFCSPSPVSWYGTAYHCHTTGDTCVNDSDCGQYQNCAFDSTNSYWSCAAIVPAPP